jgi:hypothetical protein
VLYVREDVARMCGATAATHLAAILSTERQVPLCSRHELYELDCDGTLVTRKLLHIDTVSMTSHYSTQALLSMCCSVQPLLSSEGRLPSRLTRWNPAFCGARIRTCASAYNAMICGGTKDETQLCRPRIRCAGAPASVCTSQTPRYKSGSNNPHSENAPGERSPRDLCRNPGLHVFRIRDTHCL